MTTDDAISPELVLVCPELRTQALQALAAAAPAGAEALESPPARPAARPRPAGNLPHAARLLASALAYAVARTVSVAFQGALLLGFLVAFLLVAHLLS